MDLSIYAQSGYGALMIETTEIKRAVNAINCNGSNFTIGYWDIVNGLRVGKETNKLTPVQILHHCTNLQRHIIVAENFEMCLGDLSVVQSFLNDYPKFKLNQVCFVIVGASSRNIPPVLKESIAVIDFQLPNREEIKRSAEILSDQFKEALEASKKQGVPVKKSDFTVSTEVVEACVGLSMEELENALSFSARSEYRFDPDLIISRKRQTLRDTGFMDFIDPEPIENLGGVDEFKAFIEKRREPFLNPDSIKPKLRSILLVGVQGCGKSLACKVVCSIFNLPGIIFDIGATKGKYVGETGEKIRMGTKIVDAFGRAIVIMDEIEKALEQTEFGGGKQSGGGAVADLIGHMLSWMQERTSDAIVLATSNNLGALPPEFLRSGRWDRIFFVGLPNPYEIQTIIKIHNRKWKAELPTDLNFCKQLWKSRWSPAEIEQLAKDSHYDDVESCMKSIPILAQHKATEIDKIILDGKKYSQASIQYSEELPITKRKVMIN